MPSMRQTVLALAFILPTGCQQSPPPPDHAASLRALVLEEYAPAFKSGDVERWLRLFADDAVGLHDTVPALVGKDSIRGFGEFVRDQLQVEQFDLSVEEIRIDGNWAYTRGGYQSRFNARDPEKSAPPPGDGKFVLVWARQSDGAWRIILDMGNRNAP